MKKIISIALSLFTFLSLQAQEEVPDSLKLWKFSGTGSVNFTQVSLTNWSAGGEPSYALNGLLNMGLIYTKEKLDWANTLDMGYGIQKQGEQELRKTDDHLELMSKFGYKTSKNWFISGLLNFKTQMDKGYKYENDNRNLISNFLSPGYIQLSLGLEYKPDDAFFLMLSPIGGKMTIVADDSLSAQGQFGVDPGKSTRTEMGGSVKASWSQDLVKNVRLTSVLDLFSNYLDRPGNIDVSWKVLINMKINEYLSANLNTHYIYDHDVKYVNDQGIKEGPRGQFKELFGVGLSVKF